MSQNTGLESRVRFYARIIGTLFQHQQLSGGRLQSASRAARHLSLGVRLANPLDLAKALKLEEAIALSANVEAVLAQRRAGLVVYQFQLSQALWQSYTRQDLPTPQAVGLAERRQPVTFSFEDEPHTLVAGTTGSGKTEAIKSVLVALMNIYSPADLKLVICDPNHMLTDFHNAAHLALPIAQHSQEQEQALQYVYQTLTRRKAENIKDAYILCLVLDEATDSLLTDSEIQMGRTLVKQGRAFKVNAIVGTQKPNQADLPGIIDQLLNRFVGKVANAQQSAQLTGHPGLQAHKLTGKGDFLHVANGDDATRFQVARATQADYDCLERAEVKPVRVEPAEIIDLPAVVEQKPVGRPRLEVNPEHLAWYFHHNPQQISIAMAREMLGLSREHHNRHKHFCLKFIQAYQQLRRISA